MKVLAVLWTVSLVRLCSARCCRNPNAFRKGAVNTTLDLSSPDPSLARDYESTVDGVIYYSYFPNGKLFSRIMDDGVTLWEAEGSEGCISAELYSKGYYSLLFVGIKNGYDFHTRCFEKFDGKWKEIGMEEFKNLKAAMEECVKPCEHDFQGVTLYPIDEELVEKVTSPPKPSTPITLDLSHPDEAEIVVKENKEYGVTVKVYSPKDAFHISSVMDSCKELWKAGGEERFTSAGFYTRGSLSFLAITINKGEELEYKFFKKVGGVWNEVDEELFDDEVGKMMEEYAEP
ncbi:signal peptide-containing protein [Theileria equi strain WA]|uniref:Signal peptide-containing protein n=1 Tax=Theileria equi strain WA TaxID=1537102 RepID=L0AZJ0_THEEQ|nr:signal peptide-containing protein [Theileria equi strain WA]AFZ80975.1 signal peptide-containing protein [Theileria equi strain WA]|eukprot:XP_004830641.1 signal peptide-containing protein [Theileria equi strain WA]